MSSELTVTGGPAANQDCGTAGTPQSNIMQSDTDQPNAVPELANQNIQGKEKTDATDTIVEKPMEKMDNQNLIEISKEIKGEVISASEDVQTSVVNVPVQPEIQSQQPIEEIQVQTVEENNESKTISLQKDIEEKPKEEMDNQNLIEIAKEVKGEVISGSENVQTTLVNVPVQTEIQSQQPIEETQVQKVAENNDESKTIPLQKDIEDKNPVENNSTTLKESKQNVDNETNSSKKEAEPESVDVLELTEQIMNILNEGKSEILLSPHELLKKNVELQEFILKLIQVLKEKTHLCANLERQNAALIAQAQSLKDVIAITKDLLGIRNMEVEHLHADMTSMEGRIKEERVRHNLSVSRLSEAMKLNDKLKTEYLVQMDLFQKLRDKYNEKVVTLTKENQRLHEIIKSNGLENVLVPGESEEKSNAEQSVVSEEINEENVEK